MAKIAPEIHNITRIGANGTYVTGGRDIGPHRDGGSEGGCDCSWNDITGKPNFARVATTGSYTDLGNKPTIPEPYDDSALDARVTALERGGGGSVAWNNITGKPNFATVATSGSYNDLANKPNLATVATTGSYNDLGNKPTIPEAYDDTALTGRVTALETKVDQDTKPELAAALTVGNPIGQATSGKVYPVGTSFETILRDMLTGSSPQPTTYTITFNPNGGSVTPTSGTTGTDGKLASLPTPTHATDTFTGWFTQAIGGTAVTTNTVFTSNDTIYAQWQAATQGLKVYATVSSITSLDEVTIADGLTEYILNVPAQTEENPVIIEVPTSRNVKLTIWNPLTNQWQESPQKWDVTSTTRDGVAYTRYTENCECGAAATRVRLSDWT